MTTHFYDWTAANEEVKQVATAKVVRKGSVRERMGFVMGRLEAAAAPKSIPRQDYQLEKA